jgi:DNA-binding XRE family transcriptional regulator
LLGFLPREVALIATQRTAPTGWHPSRPGASVYLAKGLSMPAQRTSMSACRASGQQSDTFALPTFIRQMPQVSARFTPTPDGHLTTNPADYGPTPTRTAPTLPRTLLSWYEQPTTSSALPRIPALTASPVTMTVKPVAVTPPTAPRRPAPQQPATPTTPGKPPVGVVIRRYRRRAGLSQVTFAGLIGRSESWISELERGARGCRNVGVLDEMARVLDIDLGKLIEVAK